MRVQGTEIACRLGSLWRGRQILLVALLVISSGWVLGGCQQPRQRPVGKSRVSAWSQPAECKVKDMKFLGWGGGGLDWSPAGDIIIYTRYDSNKVKQVFTIKPDGSEEKCLTCNQVSGGPPVRVHKGVPSWHPSGKYIILQVEMEQHPGPKWLSEPGSGWFNNIWLTTPDGTRWWQLTDYSSNKVSGVLFPKVSHDGKKLAWAEVYKGPDNPIRTLLGSPTGNPWGRWRINIADLVIDANGPHLERIQTFTPGNGHFYELQDWSSDDSKIMFAADIGRSSPYVMDVWIMDVATGELTPLTDSAADWEEHATFSPSGRRIVLMSSECCRWNPKDWKSLAAELYLMNADGSNKVQLTHFNTPGYPEYSEERSVATKATWSPDGTQLAFERILIGKGYDLSNRRTQVWLLTFQGACGAK